MGAPAELNVIEIGGMDRHVEPVFDSEVCNISSGESNWDRLGTDESQGLLLSLLNMGREQY